MSAAPAAPAEIPVQAAAEPALPASTVPAEPELSTAILSERIAAQLRGETPTPTAPEPGSEPSPGPDAPSSLPKSSDAPPEPEQSPDREGGDSREGADSKGLPKEAVAVLSHLRSEKRELKAQLKSKEDELAAFQERLDALEQQVKTADLPAPAPRPESAPAYSSPELDAARTDEDLQKRVVQGITERLRTLRRTQDPAPLLAELQNLKIQVPHQDLEGLTDYLETQREAATEKLDEAKATRRHHAERLQAESRSKREQGDSLALNWMPELADAKTARAQRASEIFQLHPGLRQDPLGAALVAAAVRGLEVLMQEKAQPNGTNGHANGNGSPRDLRGPVTPRTRLPGAPAALPQRPAEGEVTSSKLFEKFQQTGKLEDKEAWMKAALAGK